MVERFNGEVLGVSDLSVSEARVACVTRVAAIDCGTNTIRLLIADLDHGAHAVREVLRTGTITRLGQGVDRTGRLDPVALTRTLDAAREFDSIIRDHGVDRVRFVATSATRDAHNRLEFTGGIHDILGVEPEVVSGEEEARLSFAGATSAVGDQHHGPYLIVDLGGGSTELVLGQSQPEAAVSLNIGSVRLHERFLHSDPPTESECAEARAVVRNALDEAARDVPLARTHTLIGLAGTITTVTAHAQRLPNYQRERINGAYLPIARVLRRPRIW